MHNLTVARQRRILSDSLNSLGFKLLSKDVKESTNDDSLKAYALICRREAIKKEQNYILILLEKVRLI